MAIIHNSHWKMSLGLGACETACEYRQKRCWSDWDLRRDSTKIRSYLQVRISTQDKTERADRIGKKEIGAEKSSVKENAKHQEYNTVTLREMHSSNVCLIIFTRKNEETGVCFLYISLGYLQGISIAGQETQLSQKASPFALKYH